VDLQPFTPHIYGGVSRVFPRLRTRRPKIPEKRDPRMMPSLERSANSGDENESPDMKRDMV